MEYSLLKKLIDIHSVTGDTLDMEEYIKKLLEDLHVNYTQLPNGSIVCGNLESKKAFSVHLDEVGVVVTHIDDSGKIYFMPVGSLTPESLFGQRMILKTQKGFLDALVASNNKLRSVAKDCSDLFLDIGKNSYQEVIESGIKPGDTATFTKNYTETTESIFATNIDNAVSIWTVIRLIQEHKEVLDNTMIYFVHDEEMEDHGSHSIASLYKTAIVYVLDYFPLLSTKHSEFIGVRGKGPFVLYRAGNFVLNHRIKNFFESNVSSSFQKIFVNTDVLGSLESANYENNGNVSVNICVPAQGYHTPHYLILKKDLEDFYSLISELAKTEYTL